MRRYSIIALFVVVCGVFCFSLPVSPRPSLQFVGATNRWAARTGDWAVFRLTGDEDRFAIGGYFIDRFSSTGWLATPIVVSRNGWAETMHEGAKDIFVPRQHVPGEHWRLRLAIHTRAGGVRGVGDRIRDVSNRLRGRNEERFSGGIEELVAEVHSK
jgi:hypothetical protein